MKNTIMVGSNELNPGDSNLAPTNVRHVPHARHDMVMRWKEGLKEGIIRDLRAVICPSSGYLLYLSLVSWSIRIRKSI